jgi:hypothetical protein
MGRKSTCFTQKDLKIVDFSLFFAVFGFAIAQMDYAIISLQFAQKN